MKTQLVSVIIPTYKRPDYICSTIDSVLEQTYPFIEIIVVDDNGIGSEYQKKTEQKLCKYIAEGKIMYLCHPQNRNGSAARNTGFMASSGEYVNFLDDDDELYPRKIELQVKRLSDTDPSIGATYCNSKVIRIKGIINRKVEVCNVCTQEGNVLKEYLTGSCLFGTSSILFKRSAISSLGGFDESYYRHQDVELITRFFSKFTILCTSEEPLLVYDISKDRGNVASCERDYAIKEKFLSQFDSFLSKQGIKDEVIHYFWFACAANAMRYKNYQVFKKAMMKMSGHGDLSFNEYIILFKRFLVSKLAR